MTEGDWKIIKAGCGVGVGSRASIGIIGLSPDRIGVWDVEQFLAGVPDVAVFSTRVPMSSVGTPETVTALGEHLTDATALLVPGSGLDVVGFSCTSGTVAIGLDRVEKAIRAARPGIAVATPIGATLKALRRFGFSRISLLTPYRIPLAQLVAGFLESNGITIGRRCTFDLAGDLEMSAVEPDDIEHGANACMAPGSEALFISCTGLRTSGIIDNLERRFGCPVITSNQALAWECLRAAGCNDLVLGQGRLMREA